MDINIKNTTDPLEELHDIVDMEDKIIGTATRKEFLQNPKLMRRSAHIWLKNSKGLWWMQQRSKTKDLQPLHWQSACSGFIRAGAKTRHQILKDAQRELKEELGINTLLKLIKSIPMPYLSIGQIMVYWYMGEHNGPFKINREEIRDFKTFELKKVWDGYKKGKIKLTDPFVKELDYFLKHSRMHKGI